MQKKTLLTAIGMYIAIIVTYTIFKYNPYLSNYVLIKDLLSVTPFSNGWDPSIKDPWLGYKVHTGYITLESNPAKRIFYSYFKNTKNLSDSPVIIGNTGGPGLTSQYALIWGAGPYVYDPDTNIITRRENNLLEFADFLLPDLPNGTGFSFTDKYDNSVETLQNDSVEFFNQLIKSNTEKAQDLNFSKDRKIIMYGMSYGCSLLSMVSTKQLDLGYNVKSLYLESPFMNQKAFVEKFPEMIEGFNIQSGVGFENWKNISDTCLSKINNSSVKFDYNDGAYCDQMSGDGPFKNISGVTLLNGTDMRCSMKSYLDKYTNNAIAMWNKESTKKVFGGQKNMQAMNNDIYTTLFYNTFQENFDQYVGELVNRGITVSISVGNWDILCNHKVTEKWLSKLDYFNKEDRNNFNNKEWEFSEFGKKKDWDLIKYQIVEESGHIIGQTDAAVPYNKIKELVMGDVEEKPYFKLLRQ